MDKPLRRILDEYRKLSGEYIFPVVRENSDKNEIRIIYSDLRVENVLEVIDREIRYTKEKNLNLEWKLYGHDNPANLANKLTESGLVNGPIELVMVLDLSALTDEMTENLKKPNVVKSINKDKLVDYERISFECGRKNASIEREKLSSLMTENPEKLQVHLAYLNDIPVSGGRLYIHKNLKLAELAGGRTVPKYRNQGYFSATILNRISAAINAGAQTLWVDALPTSEPILTKLGFKVVTWTQPYMLPESAGM